MSPEERAYRDLVNLADHLENELERATRSTDPALSAWAKSRLAILSAAPPNYFWGAAQQARARVELQGLQNDLANELNAANLRAEAIARRRERFDPHNRDTWTINPVQYAEGLSEADIPRSPDNERVLKELQDGYLRDEHIKGISAGMRYHRHITGGSGGILFEYRLETDGTVTPYVIDVANKRDGNDYVWEKGPKGPPYR